jgi:hypothetical protein
LVAGNWSGSAGATEVQAIFQDFSSRSCRTVMQPLRGQRIGTQMLVWRCPTFRGYTVHFFQHQSGEAVRVDAPGAPAEAPQLHTRFGYANRIEWRGLGSGSDFAPQTAIIRARQARAGQLSVPVYEVLRVEAATVCRAAVLEAPATPAGLAKARDLADDIARTFRCGTSEPQLDGFDAL